MKSNPTWPKHTFVTACAGNPLPRAIWPKNVPNVPLTALSPPLNYFHVLGVAWGDQPSLCNTHTLI